MWKGSVYNFTCFMAIYMNQMIILYDGKDNSYESLNESLMK